ncbi:MAG: hypothetical protein NTW06_02670, partial [Candidatus Falkowbacteria bacterium]|nr:hypothetical protein [Candidatus Falkowbacteria bacterium]
MEKPKQILLFDETEENAGKKRIIEEERGVNPKDSKAAEITEEGYDPNNPAIQSLLALKKSIEEGTFDKNKELIL